MLVDIANQVSLGLMVYSVPRNCPKTEQGTKNTEVLLDNQELYLYEYFKISHIPKRSSQFIYYQMSSAKVAYCP